MRYRGESRAVTTEPDHESSKVREGGLFGLTSVGLSLSLPLPLPLRLPLLLPLLMLLLTLSLSLRLPLPLPLLSRDEDGFDLPLDDWSLGGVTDVVLVVLLVINIAALKAPLS